MRAARRNHVLLHTVRFVTGLNDNFSTVKSQILLMDPLPPLNKVFSMVLQHERQANLAPLMSLKSCLMLLNLESTLSRDLVFVPIVVRTITQSIIASKSTVFLHT
jgi:hypothetical protein